MLFKLLLVTITCDGANRRQASVNKQRSKKSSIIGRSDWKSFNEGYRVYSKKCTMSHLSVRNTGNS